jgi:hypothetical protein
MPRRKNHPAGAIPRTCDGCGWTSVPLTSPEWMAKKPIHEMSKRHKRGTQPPMAPTPSKPLSLKPISLKNPWPVG